MRAAKVHRYRSASRPISQQRALFPGARKSDKQVYNQLLGFAIYGQEERLYPLRPFAISALIVNLPDRQIAGSCFASACRIALRLDVDRRTVQIALRRLEAAALIIPYTASLIGVRYYLVLRAPCPSETWNALRAQWEAYELARAAGAPGTRTLELPEIDPTAPAAPSPGSEAFGSQGCDPRSHNRDRSLGMISGSGEDLEKTSTHTVPAREPEGADLSGSEGGPVEVISVSPPTPEIIGVCADSPTEQAATRRGVGSPPSRRQLGKSPIVYYVKSSDESDHQRRETRPKIPAKPTRQPEAPLNRAQRRQKLRFRRTCECDRCETCELEAQIRRAKSVHRLKGEQLAPFRDPTNPERHREKMRAFLAAVAAVRRAYPSTAPPDRPYRKPRELIWFPGALDAALVEGWAEVYALEDAEEAQRRRAEAAPSLPDPRTLPQALPVDTAPLLALTKAPLAPRPQARKPRVQEVPIDLGPLLEQCAQPRAAVAEPKPPKPPPRRRRREPIDQQLIWRSLVEQLGLPSETLNRSFYPLRARFADSVLTLKFQNTSEGRLAADTFVANYLNRVQTLIPDMEIRVESDG